VIIANKGKWWKPPGGIEKLAITGALRGDRPKLKGIFRKITKFSSHKSVFKASYRGAFFESL
jgi:hypothetical protein